MSQTVIGTFDSPSEANEAVENLINKGLCLIGTFESQTADKKTSNAQSPQLKKQTRVIHQVNISVLFVLICLYYFDY